MAAACHRNGEPKLCRHGQIQVVCSRADCTGPSGEEHKSAERRSIPGSVAFVPSVAGLIIAGEVVKDIIGGGLKKV